MGERPIAGIQDVARLRQGFDGQLLLPDEDGYHQARQVWNAIVDRQPAIIARCASSSDVAAAVRFAAERDLEIAVRCGGHSVLGLSVPAGGLMVDLSLLRSVRVDPDRRRAWVAGGALLGDLDRAAQPCGLATTSGNVSDTGVGGLTLGGGMGWLARQFGLACDNVTRFQVVTATGELVEASEAVNPELFWGLRGGGGNFGVVTEFEFELHPVGTAALIADFFYTLEDAPRVLRGWHQLIAEVPRQATLIGWTGTAGDWAYLPVEHRNSPLASVGYVWVGEPDQGRELLRMLRGLARPLAERVDELTYLELQTIDDAKHRQRLRRYWKGHYLRELTDDAIEAFLSREMAGDGNSGLLPYGGFQSYGGAIAEVGDDETAFSHRDALLEFVAVAAWADAAEDEARIAGARRWAAAIEPFASGVYVNDLADEGEAGVRRAYTPRKLSRLAALKQHYDPDNRFHLNHNIRPD